MGAHPDDIEYGCGGFLLKCTDAGHEVYLSVLTDGSATTDTDRKSEQEKSAEFLGAKDLFWGDFPDTGMAPNKRLDGNAFAYVAAWQFLAFGLLICLVWVSEVMDLPALFFATRPESVNIFRASILSAAVIICAIITVGNTYIQQRHIIAGLLMLCSTCKKIRVNQELWQDMDHYLEVNSFAAFSHGICPDCYTEIEKQIDAVEAKKEGFLTNQEAF